MKKSFFNISSATLHIIAMLFMLLDHMWATITPGIDWMTCVGRMAFPIFAFMIVEGYFHTHSLKKYMIRMFAFAAISEVPFDYMYEGNPFYPYHQNVMWTFLIALAGIWAMEAIKKKGKLWLTILVSAIVILIGFLLGFLFMVDYYGTGILMVFTFYLFRGRKWWNYLGQFAVMYYLNVELLGGYYYPITLFGHEFELIQQGMALFAFVPIWLYQGRQGYHAKWFQYFCYGFYPLHITVLLLLSLI